MYTEPDKSAFFTDLKNLITDYIRIRLELTRATAFEKIARVVTYMILGFVSALLFFFGMLFISMLLADYLSEVYNSRLAGYATVAGFYFLLFILVARSGDHWLGRKITNGIIRILFEQKHNHAENGTQKDS